MYDIASHLRVQIYNLFRVGSISRELERCINFIRKQLVFYTLEYFIILFEFISLED